MPINARAITGFVSDNPIRSATRQFKNGPANSRAAKRGMPRTMGMSGSPSKSSGGATIISIMCCSMWAVRTKPENVSRGEASANQSANNPNPKDPSLQAGR